MRDHRLFRAALLGALLLPRAVAAQERQITGTVAKADRSQTIAEAQVAIVGALRGVRTSGDGRFTIQAPSGVVRLLVRAIGYQRQEVTVAANQSTVDVALAADVFRLEEVVVSGQVTGVERRNSTTAIAYVSGEDVSKVAAPTIESSLAGRLSGVNIQSNSGAPGGGLQIQIRGATTILGASDPLYVVDGVIYSNARINSGRALIVYGVDFAEDEAVNRIADINPADIASIEILKGAAASSIYGSKAANGVVVINTIRGRSGRPRINVSQRLGTFGVLRTLQARRFASIDDAVAAFGEGARAYAVNGALPYFDHYDEIYGRHALSYETVADISGGNEDTKYFISGTWKRDEGISLNTGFGRQAIRVNVDQKLSSRMDVKISSVFNRAQHARGWNNNNNNFAGTGYPLTAIPSFVPLLPKPDGTFDAPLAGVFSNPYQNTSLARNETETNRFTGGATLNYRVQASDRSSLHLIASGGADIFQQGDDLLSPSDLFYEQLLPQPGRAVVNVGDSRQVNWNLNGVHTFRPAGGGFQSTASLGVQFEDRRLKSRRIFTVNILPGQKNVDQGTSTTVDDDFTHERTMAFYGQEEIKLFNDRLTLIGGVRGERSSVNGDIDRYFFYPKASASYQFDGLFGPNTYFKIRGAYGVTGNQPLFGQKFTLLDTPTLGGEKTLIVSAFAGSPNVRPERLEEFEAGVDGTLWGGRGTFEITAFSRTTNDLLLNRVPAGSSGFSAQIFNGGKLRNQGIEAAIGITAVQTSDLSLVARTTFTTLRNRVIELPISPFNPPRAGFGLGDLFIEEGQSITRLYGPKYGKDTSEILRGTVGNTNPDFRLGLVTDLTYRAVSFTMMWDWQQGGNTANLTLLLYDLFQNSPDYDTPAAQERIRLASLGLAPPYIESATFLKLREVTLGVSVPPRWIKSLGVGARDARISVSGRNLFMFTKYRGLDPEVSNFGSLAIRNNIDVAPFPPSRSIFFNFALGF